MRAKKDTVKLALRNEFRVMTKAIAAFAVATLLLFLQGSFGELNKHSAFALFAFTAIVPICVLASFMSFIFSQRTHVPAWAENVLDMSMGAAWFGGIYGLGALLYSASDLLAIVYAASIGIACSVFVLVAHFLSKGEGASSSEKPVDGNATEFGPNTKENR